MYDLQNTEVSFVHRRIISAATGFLSGGPLGAVTGAVTGGGKRKKRRFDPGCMPPTYMRDVNDNCVVAGAASTSIVAPSVCIPPWFPKPGGGCELDLVPGPGGGGTGPIGRDQGEAIMGRYGAAMVPTLIDRDPVRDCLPGMILGKDFNCYNSRDITNKERLWPKGRAPLLTGGERNAISVARRAAAKLERTTKALQDMGMMKKPTPKTKTRTVTKMIGPGSPSIINVE